MERVLNQMGVAVIESVYSDFYGFHFAGLKF